MATNDHLILISGKSATGKSASLMNIDNPEGVMYLNCENGKKLPFKNKFRKLTITDVNMVFQAIDEAETMPEIHSIVVDTMTYLMDLFESTRVITAADSQKAWGHYFQYWKVLMQSKVANSSKNIIFLAHTSDILNKSEMVNETMVKVKGSLMNQGIESYFTTVISTKKIPLSVLTNDVASSPLFNITEEDKLSEFKYVFQTRLTKETVNERIRSPMDMWKRNETFIDNNIQYVINRLTDYYLP